MKKKTHRGTKKRFRVTKKGKILHKKANKGHILSKKSKKRKRALRIEGEVSRGDKKVVKKLLNI